MGMCDIYLIYEERNGEKYGNVRGIYDVMNEEIDWKLKVNV